MRFSSSYLAFLALPTAAIAVSLSDFYPRPNSLPGSCQAVYTQNIEGCAPSDWAHGTSKTGCSKGCITALSAMTPEVKKACGNKGVEGQNIIVAFLAGQGPQSVCSNAEDVLAGSNGNGASSTSAFLPTKTSGGHSSTVEASSIAATRSVTSSAIAAISTDSGSSTGIVLDSSTLPTVSSTTPHGSSRTHASDSGGGSPFDTEGDAVSVGTTSGAPLATLLLFFLIFAAAQR